MPRLIIKVHSHWQTHLEHYRRVELDQSLQNATITHCIPTHGTVRVLSTAYQNKGQTQTSLKQ